MSRAQKNIELDIDVKTITDILTYCRPHQSKSEKQFISAHLDTVPGMTSDYCGNRILQIGASPILFSAHTDTVHGATGRQTLTTTKDGLLRLKNQKRGYVLGADDGAGIWVLLELIKAKIPGLYIFHRGEEVGGIGSNFIANNTPELLDGIDFAIAFDRLGTSSVITHQCGRTTSDTFAQQFADLSGMPDLAPDAGGIFTDTATYSSLVSECTNISVGYESAHRKTETLDLAFLIQLRDALIKMNWTKLVACRDPSVTDPLDHWYYDSAATPDYTPSYNSGFENMIKDNADVVAMILEHFGIDEYELATEIDTYYRS